MLFKMIPEIYAGNLPEDVRTELIDWNDELCFHGDGGCVFTLHDNDAVKLPLFIAWMVEIGAWTKEQVSFPTYNGFCSEMGYSIDPPYAFYKEFNAKYGNKRMLSVAMTGT